MTGVSCVKKKRVTTATTLPLATVLSREVDIVCRSSIIVPIAIPLPGCRPIWTVALSFRDLKQLLLDNADVQDVPDALNIGGFHDSGSLK